MQSDTQPAPLPTDLPPLVGIGVAPTAAVHVAPHPLSEGSNQPINTPIYPNAGEQVMAKSPAVNSQWEVCTVQPNPNDPALPLVVFPDGTQYTADSVTLGGKVSQASPEPVTPLAPTLKPDYNAFKSLLVSMDAQSQRLFDLPLDILIIMVQRYAIQRSLAGSGKMGKFAGVSQFVADSETFDSWIETYMLEIQRREAEKGSPEM